MATGINSKGGTTGTSAVAKKDAAMDDLMEAGAAEDITALAAVESQDMVQVVPGTYSSTPDFDQSDLWVSKIRLAQGLTPEVQSGEAKPGQWVLTGMTPTDSPTVIPLRYAKLQRRFGIVGGQRYIACNRHQGDVNQDCPNCRTQFEEKLRNNPGFDAIIEDYYSYMVYCVEAEMPAMLEFARTGMGAGRLLNTFAVSKGLGNFAIKLGGNSQKGEKGSYWVPTVKITDVPADIMEMAKIFATA